jgi:hypothetical protein
MQFARHSTAEIIGIRWGAYFAKCARDYGSTERSPRRRGVDLSAGVTGAKTVRHLDRVPLAWSR